MLDHLDNKRVILASSSPRRSFLLNEIGIKHIVRKIIFDESFPKTMPPLEVSLFVATKKSEQILDIDDNDIYIFADTVVVLENEILEKPKNKIEALKMLSKLSNNTHQVVTGVTILSKQKRVSFKDVSKVHFKAINEKEIEHYIDLYKPFDKSGSYGIQEWIGMIGIDSIEGSYFNIMGLPTHRVYEELLKF